MVVPSMVVDVVRIFPPIGIARLGSSHTEYFIGPEFPGQSPPSDGYKDSQFRVKRQGARFRLFGYQAGSSQPNEITLDDAEEITWKVELANRKGETEVFGKGKNVPSHQSLHSRNKKVTNRESLYIKPGSRTITVTPDKPIIPNQEFDTGTFLGTKVYLGEILVRPEDKGRLIVLGGRGFSESPRSVPFPNGLELHNFSHGDEDGGWQGDFADNDGWYDDVSDGPVNASVRIKGMSEPINALPAWVICAPPKFAPQIEHVITLYDTLLQVTVDRPELKEKLNSTLIPRDRPSFTQDIYPLLLRTMNLKWVSKRAVQAHSQDSSSSSFKNIYPSEKDTIEEQNTRSNIFKRLRDPSTEFNKLGLPKHDMPQIWSDYYIVYKDPTGSGPYPPITEALTRIQYSVLEQWKKNNFDRDWAPGGSPLPETVITPEGLTRAALENCVGGAFYPGIETSFNIRDMYAFIEPFRLDASNLEPGDLTKQLCVPWQADFFDCQPDNGSSTGDEAELSLDWWPAQRPVDVFDKSTSTVPVYWTREIIREVASDATEEELRQAMMDMINNWDKLGFVLKQTTDQGDRFVETDRHV